MGAVNAAIEVGKHQLEVALGSAGELFGLENQPRAIRQLVQRLAGLGCARVLIEGGSYQNVLVGALRAARCRWSSRKLCSIAGSTSPRILPLFQSGHPRNART